MRSMIGCGYSPAPVIVPGFAIHQRLTPWADLRLGVQDYITGVIGDGRTSHNFALTAGVVW